MFRDVKTTCGPHNNKMAEFKISVESLHTSKVKEINYEGEEVYEESVKSEFLPEVDEVF